jgi:hypothetical protein
MQTRLARTLSLGLAAAALLVTAGLSADAQARRPNVTRKGGQFGVMLGGSACIPGQAECTRDLAMDDAVAGVTVDGKTRPSVGLGGELGYRFNKWVFAGAAYNLGFFDTSYEITGAADYRRAMQNSVFGVVRPTLPLWRFDFGLGIGPGFSRQTFVRTDGTKDYSQGFALLISPTIDVFVSRRIFVGAKLDLIVNAHGRTCRETSTEVNCTKQTYNTDLAPVHQMIFGLHLGGTFL